MICRSCGEKDDHTAKNCPYKPDADDVELGPTFMECGHFTWWNDDGECSRCNQRQKLKAQSCEAPS